MTWASTTRIMAAMQPTTIPTQPTTTSRDRAVRRRLAIGGVAVALASMLAACGGGSSSDGATAKADGSSSETTAPASTDTGGEETTTTAIGGAPDIDLCEEVTKDDVAAILTEASLTAATANDAIPAPNCGYQIDLGGGSGMTADVVTIVWNNPDFFDAQKELQTDEVDLTGLDTDAFSFGDGGDVLVRGATGTWAITKGVELSAGGQQASDEQILAIAKLVQGL